MPLLTSSAAGVFPIAPTPFNDNGAIDWASVDRMCDVYLAAGATGLTILGIMGEAPKMTGEESRRIVDRVLRRIGGRIPVIVGVSSPGFAAMTELAKASMGAGAAAVMVAPVSSCRTDDQIVGYFAGAGEAVGADTPFVIQDYPLTTGVQMTVKVIQRIVAAIPACVMLKHEDWPGLDKITALRRGEAAGECRRLSILTGNGGLFLNHEMDRGADGAMTGYAFPEMLVEVVRLSREGRRSEAHDVFDRHLPLVRYEQQQGPGLAVRKYVMKRRGIIASDAQRRPGAKLSPESIADVEFLLSRLGPDALKVAV
jgi:4-hydroxy-tetrahydrodipicolinate synthase